MASLLVGATELGRGERRYSLSDSADQSQGLKVDGSPDMLSVKVMDTIEKLMFFLILKRTYTV